MDFCVGEAGGSEFSIENRGEPGTWFARQRERKRERERERQEGGRGIDFSVIPRCTRGACALQVGQKRRWQRRHRRTRPSQWKRKWERATGNERTSWRGEFRNLEWKHIRRGIFFMTRFVSNPWFFVYFIELIKYLIIRGMELLLSYNNIKNMIGRERKTRLRERKKIGGSLRRKTDWKENRWRTKDSSKERRSKANYRDRVGRERGGAGRKARENKSMEHKSVTRVTTMNKGRRKKCLEKENKK